MATTYKIVTFDVYSALLDIQGSMTRTLADRLNLAENDAAAMMKTWREKQMARAAMSNSLCLGRVPFKTCTRLGLDYVLAQRGMDLTDADRNDLVKAWDVIDPWPEAKDVVSAIKAKGHTTAVLSNGDQDQLEAVSAQFGADMDHVLSSETAGNYKPHPSVYELPTRILGVTKTDVLHVAGSPNDALGATAFGMPCYWSNRQGDIPLDPAYAAPWSGADLRGVLSFL